MRAVAGMFFASLAAFLTAAPALSQDAAGAGTNQVEALRACRAITGDAQRLACFDRAAGEVLAAADKGDIRLVTRGDIEQTKRGLFGFSLPKLNIFGGGRDDDEKDAIEPLDMLESTVTAARQIDRTTYVFTIADGGATWQIKDAQTRFIPPKRGDKVVFKRAALGSYFIRINGQIGVKGKRID